MFANAVDKTTMNSLTNKPTSASIDSGKKLSIIVGGYSRAGLKDENQDAFAALTPSGYDLTSKGAVVAIADGVSSATNAAQASQMAVTQFITEYYGTSETWSTRKSAAKVLKGLNQWLNSQQNYQQNTCKESGHLIQGTTKSQWLTTFTSLILKSATAYIFHVGDTRVSKYAADKLTALTRDHNCKLAGSQVILTRALGADPHLEVDCYHTEINAGDIFMLTCDGVHDFVPAEKIVQTLSSINQESSQAMLERASRNIVDYALLAGSDDNVTCVIVYTKHVPSRQLSEIHRELTTKAIPPALNIGQTIDKFVVKKHLHASTRSHLYLVEHPEHKSCLVLKTPSVNFAHDPIYLQGFAREAWVGEKLNHRNIMRVRDDFPKSKFLYHICEHVEGQSLTDWMHDNPQPTIAMVRDIVLQVVSALRAFQRHELVHRDLKPDNIMINQYGHVTLIDYGTVSAAALNELQETIVEDVPQGTLNYVAPESLLTLFADHKSDLFSLAVVCYQMLCGQLPYRPMTVAQASNKPYDTWHYRSIRQFRSDMPIWIDLMLEKALSPDPKDRFDAFSELEAALNKPAETALAQYKARPLIQRNPVQFWQLVSCVLLIALLVSVLT